MHEGVDGGEDAFRGHREVGEPGAGGVVAAAPGERTPILRGVSFQIEQGKTLAVIGPLLIGGGFGARYSLLAFPLIWPIADWLGLRGSRRVQWVAPLTLIVVVALVLQLHYIHS